MCHLGACLSLVPPLNLAARTIRLINAFSELTKPGLPIVGAVLTQGRTPVTSVTSGSRHACSGGYECVVRGRGTKETP